MAQAIPVADAQLLAAQALSGQAGVDAYKNAQSTLTTQRNDAVQRAMQEAALRGAPAGAAESQAGIITAPYDQRIASLAQGQGAYEADMAARNQRYSAYEGAINSARTLIPGQVELAVAPIRAQGEATIRNTTRQGIMAVSEIEANQRLTEAKMAAAFQAAQIAAAKDAAAKAKDANKLTKAGLEGMLSQGVAAQMQGSLGDINSLIQQREAQATGARKTAFDTAMQQATSQQQAAQGRQADLRAQVADQAARNRLQAINTEFPAHPPVATGPYLPGTRPSLTTPPVAPPKPSVTGLSADAAEATLSRWRQAMQQYQQQLANYQSAQRTSAAAGTAPATMGADRMAALIAEQRNTAAIAGGVKPYESAYITEQAATSPYRSQFGSFSNDDLRSITGQDPYLASLLVNSPEPITSQNMGRLLAGTPDQYGRTSEYAQQAVQLAQQVVAQRLIDAGYEIDPNDYASVTTPQMKPGETFAQFLGRIGGGMSDQEIIDAQEKQRRQNVTDTRSDITFQEGQNTYAQSQAEWEATHNPDGSEKVAEQPTTPAEQRASAAADRQTNLDAAATWISNNLPYMPPSGQFGDALKVGNAASQPIFNLAMQSVMTSKDPEYVAGVGMSLSDWNRVQGKLRADPTTAALTPYQLSLLKEFFVEKKASGG